jgi:hypothetical protein
MEFSADFTQGLLEMNKFLKIESVVEHILKILDEKIKLDFSHVNHESHSNYNFDGTSTENKSFQNLSKIMTDKKTFKITNSLSDSNASSINSHLVKFDENLKMLLTEIINTFNDDLIKNMQKNPKLDKTSFSSSEHQEEHLRKITNMTIYSMIVKNFSEILGRIKEQTKNFLLNLFKENDSNLLSQIILLKSNNLLNAHLNQSSNFMKDSMIPEKNVINITNNFNSQLSIFNSLISNEEISLELNQQSPFSIKFWRDDTKDKEGGITLPNKSISDSKICKKNTSFKEDKNFDVITKSTRSSSSSKVSSMSRRLTLNENITGSSLTYGEGPYQYSSSGQKYVTPFECKSEESVIDCKKINIPVYDVNQDTPIFQTEKSVQSKVNLSSLKKVSKNLFENFKKIKSDYDNEINVELKFKEKLDKKSPRDNNTIFNPSISLLLSIISSLFKNKLITPQHRRNLKEKVLEKNEYFMSKLIEYEEKRDFKKFKQEVLKLI